VILLAMAVPSSAGTLSVAVEAAAGVELLKPIAIQAEGSNGKTVQILAGSASPAQRELENGPYRVALTEPGLWAEPRDVYVGPAGASVHLIVYRASIVTGRVTARGVVPSRLIARFQGAAGAAPRGDAVCTIERRSFSCPVPAARLDLSLKAPGCVTRYRWNVDAAAQTADVGVVDLVPGATLTGYVSVRRGVPLEKAVVSAAPMRPAPAFDVADRSRGALESQRVPVNGHGFFHFDGIAPGDYTLEASAGTLRSARQQVRVIETAEAELRTPLALEEPHDVEVLVHPSRDVYNRRWIVKLERQTNVGMLVETERQESLPADGRTTLQSIPAGSYTLVLRTESGETWAQREILVPGAPVVEITVPKTFVRGRLTLDKQPLQANLEFRHVDGAAVAARSGADGTFALFFPESDAEWIEQIRIRSDAPHVQHVMNNVQVEKDERGNAFIGIDLPPTYLAGTVVDAQSRRVRAIVRVESAQEGVWEIPTNEEGEFEIHALPAGRLRLRAYAARATSNAVDVDVAEDGRAEDVRLMVQPARRLTGRVFSSNGPIPGAAIYAFPQPGGAIASPIATTGPDGRYDISLPAEAADVDVFAGAPSFATQFFRQRIPEASDLDLRLTQTQGTLIVESPDVKRTVVRHRGAEVGLNLFAYHGGVREANGLRIPNLEPGLYLICNAAAECEPATVIPNGEVRVRLK
jgi:hypothetical protein